MGERYWGATQVPIQTRQPQQTPLYETLGLSWPGKGENPAKRQQRQLGHDCEG